MLTRNAAFAALVLCLLVLHPSPARAAEPPERVTVTYNIRETPTDPQSDIVFRVELELESQSWTAGQVTWEIMSALFTQPGEKVSTWKDDMTTTLWAVNHNDIGSPLASEFDQLPELVGTAAAQDPADPDLDYDLHGQPPEGTPVLFNGLVSALTYLFALVGEEEPQEEGEDELSEIDLEEDS